MSFWEALEPFRGSSGAEFEKWAKPRRRFVAKEGRQELAGPVREHILREALQAIRDLRPAHAERIARAALA